MKLKRSITALCIVREAAKMAAVMAGILFIALPEAWAEGGQPLLLVLLAMAGCAGIMYGAYRFARRADYRVYCLRRACDRAEQWEREAPLREARRREEWRRWLAEQEAQNEHRA